MKSFNPQDYWEERLRNSLGLHGVGYQGMGKSYNQWLYRVRRRIFLREISSLKIDLKAVNVIDIGSGTGFYIERWKELEVNNIVGTDITQVSVDFLQKKYPDHQFYRMDIGGDIEVPLEPGSYDIATAFDVLFHIVEDVRFEKAIQNIHTLLRPGGWFVFSDNFLHNHTERVPNQVSRSLPDIAGTLARTGFTIMKRSPMFVMMNDPVDSTNHYYRLAWSKMAAIIQKADFLGQVFGAVLYPWELLLTNLLAESSSTEIMICQKQG